MNDISKTTRNVWLDSPKKLFENTAVTLGSFDGIHLGHRELLNTLIEKSSHEKLIPILATLDPHPRLVFDDNFMILTTSQEREFLLTQYNISAIVHIRFTCNLASLSCRDFIKDYLVNSFNAKLVVIGYDYHFGKRREGTPETLKSIGKEMNFNVEVIPSFKVQSKIVKSSTIRELILKADIRHAIDFLGHNYLICGETIPGRGIGAELGYPTANMKFPSHKLLPLNGVYAALAGFKLQSASMPAIVYIGTAPTFEQTKKTFEVHIFDIDKDLYGKQLNVELLDFIRPELKFKTLKDLKAQIGRDITETQKRIKLYSSKEQ